MAMKIFGAPADTVVTDEVSAAEVQAAPVETIAAVNVVPEAAPVETVEVALEETPAPVETEVVPEPEFADDVVGALDKLMHQLSTLRTDVVAIKEGTIIGKAAFKKAVVKTREKMLPLAKDVKSIWRDLHEIGKEAVSEVASARKVKTPESIAAEIAALQARLASMTAE